MTVPPAPSEATVHTGSCLLRRSNEAVGNTRELVLRTPAFLDLFLWLCNKPVSLVSGVCPGTTSGDVSVWCFQREREHQDSLADECLSSEGRAPLGVRVPGPGDRRLPLGVRVPRPGDRGTTSGS